ncbi:hypothetical protein GALMADRAFT_93994 [Galerina marginata CBS 339.88]|uniref:Transcription factor Pcc1 n=1 Tax=Galerina marginata (strain CBS 339.88) TaxID=685588 RepID=A0A067TG51_GALM3|nr:hypothetical protein GALMADRAFT_93994 [Galerina marginata CBS 339.88]
MTAAGTPNVDWHTINVEIPLASNKHALIVKQVIEVDAELQPHAVKRELVVQDEKLIATFHTLTVRLARLTLNAFLENVDLVVRTIEVFGPDDSNSDKRTS